MIDSIADEECAFDMSSPQSLRNEASPSQLDHNAHNYNFSGIVYDESTDYTTSTDDEQFLSLDSRFGGVGSRHSSVSSFPSSIIHHTSNLDRSFTPTRSPSNYERAVTPKQSPRHHSTGFRHPSSVRAMQMQDEFGSTDVEDLTHTHRRRDSRMSHLSYRSSGSNHSSPSKYMRISRSAHSSPYKTKLKKEFPLVLLHCTLLPPALYARANLLSSENSSQESILEAIIPQPYVQRWKTLQDKVVRNPEVKTRGILIPHPKDDYELLEERLLETLELEGPRIRQGHFLASRKVETSTDSGFESGSAESESEQAGEEIQRTRDEGEHCPDCGHNFSSDVEQIQKWEVKIFAANGLMKAGAWSAAWSEMEKVDVEVGVWMPEDVRREVDLRLEALIAKDVEEKPKRRKSKKGIDDDRAREIYGDANLPDGENVRKQEAIDGLVDELNYSEPAFVGVSTSGLQNHEQHQPNMHQYRPMHTHIQPDLTRVCANYVRLLVQDSRNVAIVLLSILVLYYGVSNQAQSVTPPGGNTMSNAAESFPAAFSTLSSDMHAPISNFVVSGKSLATSQTADWTTSRSDESASSPPPEKPEAMEAELPTGAHSVLALKQMHAEIKTSEDQEVESMMEQNSETEPVHLDSTGTCLNRFEPFAPANLAGMEAGEATEAAKVVEAKPLLSNLDLQNEVVVHDEV